MSRFLSFAAFNLSALGNRRSGMEKAAVDASYPAPSLRGHHRQTVKPRTAGARRQDRPGQLLGERPLTGQEAPRVGGTFGRGKQPSEERTPSCLRGARRDLLAGYKRFSKGLAERRDADLSGTTTFTTGLSRHNVSINHKQTRTANTLMPMSAREPRCLRFPSARSAGLGDECYPLSSRIDLC